MNKTNTSPESLAQMSTLVLANFKIINNFAKEQGLTISGVYGYIAIGSLSILKLDDGQIMFVPISPSRAAAQLNFNLKKMGRLFLTLVNRGLLSREGGSYQMTDFSKWVNIANLLNIVIPNLDYPVAPKFVLAAFPVATPVLLAASNHGGAMRDRH